MATPKRDKEGFILVDRKRQKKRKAEHSPLLHTPPGSSSASSSGSPTRSRPSSFNFPNTVPIIFRYPDAKFTSVKQVMSELSQYHPELRVSRVKDLPNQSFLIVGNTPRDVVILQSETKMKACLGKNLKVQLHSKNKLSSNERARKMQKNEPSLTPMRQMVLEISHSKVRNLSKMEVAILKVFSLILTQI